MSTHCLEQTYIPLSPLTARACRDRSIYVQTFDGEDRAQYMDVVRTGRPYPPPALWLPTKEDWENFKDIITFYYLHKGMNVRQIINEMKLRYGFRATENMFKTHLSDWKIRKNNREDKMMAMVVISRQRARDGKETVFENNGRLITYRHIHRYFQRRRHKMTDKEITEFVTETDAHAMNLRCFTPEPSPTQINPPAFFLEDERAFWHVRQIIEGFLPQWVTHVEEVPQWKIEQRDPKNITRIFMGTDPDHSHWIFDDKIGLTRTDLESIVEEAGKYGFMDPIGRNDPAHLFISGLICFAMPSTPESFSRFRSWMDKLRDPVARDNPRLADLYDILTRSDPDKAKYLETKSCEMSLDTISAARGALDPLTIRSAIFHGTMNSDTDDYRNMLTNIESLTGENGRPHSLAFILTDNFFSLRDLRGMIRVAPWDLLEHTENVENGWSTKLLTQLGRAAEDLEMFSPLVVLNQHCASRMSEIFWDSDGARPSQTYQSNTLKLSKMLGQLWSKADCLYDAPKELYGFKQMSESTVMNLLNTASMELQLFWRLLTKAAIFCGPEVACQSLPYLEHWNSELPEILSVPTVVEI